MPTADPMRDHGIDASCFADEGADRSCVAGAIGVLLRRGADPDLMILDTRLILHACRRLLPVSLEALLRAGAEPHDDMLAHAVVGLRIAGGVSGHPGPDDIVAWERVAHLALGAGTGFDGGSRHGERVDDLTRWAIPHLERAGGRPAIAAWAWRVASGGPAAPIRIAESDRVWAVDRASRLPTARWAMPLLAACGRSA